MQRQCLPQRPRKPPLSHIPPRKRIQAEPAQGLTKMLLDSVEDVHAVLAVNHVYCQAPLAKAACAPNAVQVGLIVWVSVLVHRKVKIDDHRHLFNINTCTRGLEGGRRETKRGTIRHTYPLALKIRLGQVTSGMWPLKSTPLKRAVAEAKGHNSTSHGASGNLPTKPGLLASLPPKGNQPHLGRNVPQTLPPP